MVAFLQEDNVAGDFCTGISLEGVVRQADGSNQVGTLGQIFAYSRIFLIHRAFAGDKGHDTARTHLIQRLPKEIVMDKPVVLVVPLIYHFEIPKGTLPVSYTHLRAHETDSYLGCRLLLEKIFF